VAGDPRRERGVSVYRQQERAFSIGDRVQLIAPLGELKAAGDELGTVEGSGLDGRLSLRVDGGRGCTLLAHVLAARKVILVGIPGANP
jgi:hypothetical protein